MELHDLRSFNELVKKDRNLASQVENVYTLTKPIIDNISKHFSNYTMHDTNHGIRVARYMEQLAFGINDDEQLRNMEKFNALELSIMILSALLHDIGMFIRDQDIDDIRNDNIKYSNSITYKGVLKIKGTDEETIKEIIRLTHAPRVREFVCSDISKDGSNISKILKVNNDYPYFEDVIKICESHGKDYSYIKENLNTETTKGDYTYNSQYIAVLLRIADYLDLDKQRTPILWFSIMGIEGFSREEWETHFQIHNDKKLKYYTDNKLQVFFDGESSNPKIHRKYLRYVDGLKIELDNAIDLLNTKNAPQKYTLNIISKIEDRVKTVGFQYSDLRLNLDYSSITDLLMGKNIYGDSKLGLRELIQNSIDSCKIMSELQSKNPDMIIPIQISLSLSKKNNTVKIKDSGTGMSLDIVKKHFLNVGKSYYKSSEYISQNREYKPIGQYGIGFLACFLLSDNVVVKTKHYGNNEIIQIALEKHSEYVVTKTEETPNFYGTEITLDYDKFFEVFKSIENLKSFISRFFITDIPIKIRDEDSNSPYEQINNVCEKEIEPFTQKRENVIAETLECNGELSGKIVFNYSKRSRFKVCNLLDSPVYLYNPKTKIFELSTQVPNGYYSIYEYTILEKEKYYKIVSSKKSIEELINAIKSLSRKEHKNILLLINSKDDIDIEYFNFDFDDTKEIEEIICSSGLPFYEILFYYSNNITAFVSENKYTRIALYQLDTFWYRKRHFNSQNDNVGFYFYNKDILVKDFRRVRFYLPYKYDDYELRGYINYKGDDLKLDVSRNEIIEGNELINSKIFQFILNQKIIHEKNDQNISILKAMIEYDKNDVLIDE